MDIIILFRIVICWPHVKLIINIWWYDDTMIHVKQIEQESLKIQKGIINAEDRKCYGQKKKDKKARNCLQNITQKIK